MKTVILLIALAVLSADQLEGRERVHKKGAKFGALCSGNPRNIQRGCEKEAYGMGPLIYSRAKGKQTREGVKIMCNDGDTVLAPFDVTIFRRARPFGNGNAIDDGILLRGKGLCFMLFHVKPDKTRGSAKKGQRIGTVLPVKSVFPRCTSHIHVEMCNKGNPNKYF